MADVRNEMGDQRMTDEHQCALTRRTFLKRMMTITGCTAAGVLLNACGTPTTTTQATVTASASTSATVSASASVASGGPGGGAGSPPAGGGGPGGGDETLDAFVGVTTDGSVVPDLFAVQATGVSTEPIVTAAAAFLAALTDEQRTATLFTVDDDEWRKWSNVDSYQRQGTSLEAMTEAQRTAAMAMLGAALSAKGLETSQNIMKLNTVQGELVGNTDQFNELLYYVTVMGEPSTTEPWGFQLDGHHLIINYFVLGDQVVMAPVFLGSEPPVAPEGVTYAGTSILQDEQNKGLAMVQALTDEQRTTAIIESAKTADNLQAGAFSDNAQVAYAGIKGDALTSEQQTQLLDLISAWVGTMRDGHAAVKMTEVQRYIADTYFAWIGDTADDAVFYYRIQSPVILIEFDHQRPGPLAQNPDYAGDVPTRNHIHAMLRTPNGNDYGKSLLAQHLQAYDHQPTATGVKHVPRTATASMASTVAAAAAAMILPPQYRNGTPVSAAPMGAADLIYDAQGQVAWNEMWTDFCDLALAGGPPHRGTLLEPATPNEVRADPTGYARVMAELARGVRMVTGLEVVTDAALGWIGVCCTDEAMARWLLHAIVVENVAVRREGAIVFLPAGPAFRLDTEIKNVVTVVAKTHHYWTEHAIAPMIA